MINCPPTRESVFEGKLGAASYIERIFDAQFQILNFLRDGKELDGKFEGIDQTSIFVLLLVQLDSVLTWFHFEISKNSFFVRKEFVMKFSLGDFFCLSNLCYPIWRVRKRCWKHVWNRFGQSYIWYSVNSDFFSNNKCQLIKQDSIRKGMLRWIRWHAIWI